PEANAREISSPASRGSNPSPESCSSWLKSRNIPSAKSFCSACGDAFAAVSECVCGAFNFTDPNLTIGVFNGTTACRKRSGPFGDSHTPSRCTFESVSACAPEFSQLVATLSVAASAAATSGCGGAILLSSVICSDPDLLKVQNRKLTDTLPLSTVGPVP